MHRIFSVDDHIIEPADVWTSRVGAKYRDVAPHVVEDGGREYWEYEDKRIPTMGLNAVAGLPREQWTIEPARFSDMIPGCYDPKARALDLLSQGVLASVSFPTLPRFGGMLFPAFKDKELADVCVKAWNDFVLDEWCPAGPEGLYVPMVICQLWDPALAAAEITRCVERGAAALCFVENPVHEGLPTFHSDHWDPIWRVAEEADIPVCMHIGSSGFAPIPDPAAPLSGAISLGQMAGMMSMVNFLVSPVCHKFPKIKLVFSEGGIGWVPAILERCDRMIDRHQYWSGGLGDIKPSEIFARNMYVCMVEEQFGLKCAEDIGVDRILSETDYPHSDGPYPHTQASYGELVNGLPTDLVEAVSHGNAERLFNWKMADPALAESPEVVAWRKTLAGDPFAAMKLRGTVEGITHSVAVATGNCQESVFRAPNFEPCGKPMGPDGRCPDGHGAVTAAAGARQGSGR